MPVHIHILHIYILIPARRARNQRRRGQRELFRLKHSPCRSVNTEASFHSGQCQEHLAHSHVLKGRRGSAAGGTGEAGAAGASINAFTSLRCSLILFAQSKQTTLQVAQLQGHGSK